MSKKIVTYSDIVNSGGLPESLSSLRCVTLSGLDKFSNVVYKYQGVNKTWQQLINEYEYEIQNWEYRLVVDPKITTIAEGDTIDLSAEYTTKLNDSESSTENVTKNAAWYSDDTSIADMVDGRFGRVIGISQGTTKIWAEYEDEKDYCEITVEAVQEPDIPDEPVMTYKLNISAESESIQLGSTTQLTATLITYEDDVELKPSEDVTNDVEWYTSPEACTISNGIFTPSEAGIFTIYAVLNDIYSNTISIDVTSQIVPEDEISYVCKLIIEPKSNVTYGEEIVHFKATYIIDEYKNGVFNNEIYNEVVTNECQWSIDNPTVGTIDLNGVATIYNIDGNATVTAYFEGLEDYDGASGSASITSHYVEPIPEVTVERIVLTTTTSNETPGNIVSTITGREGSTSSIYVWAYYSDGSKGEVSGDSNCICTIQNTSIAWYTTNNIMHNNVGETVFDVSYTYNGETVTASAKIITSPAIPTDIEASLNNVYIKEGESAKVTLSGTLSNDVQISESGYFSIDKTHIDTTRADITLRGNEIDIIGLERSNDAEDYIGYITAYFMYNDKNVSCNIDVYVYNEESLRYEIRITAENDPYASQVEQINMSINDVKTLYAYFYIYDKDELIETPKYIGIDGTWTTTDHGIVSGANGGEISNGGIYSHNIEGTAYISINYLYNGITYTSDTVSVHVRDENSYSYDLSVNPPSVELEFGVHTTWQVHCTATISVTAPNGSVTTTSKDVSEDVTIVSYDSRIINVSKGKDPEGDPYILLSAVSEGTTTVEFSYGESTKDIAYASLDVTVLPVPVYNVNLDVSPSEVTAAYKGEILNFIIMEDAYKNNVQISGYPYNVSNVVDINIDNTDVIKVLSQGNDKVSFECLGHSNPTSIGDSINITFSHISGSYGTPEPVTVPVTVYTPFISISHYEASYSHLGGVGDIGVACLTQLGFTVSKTDDWISIETTSGNDGDQIRFSVSQNLTWNSRTGYIIFTSGNVTATYTITQDALRQLDSIAVNPSSISVSSAEVGNAYPITITGSFNDYSYTEVIPNNKVIINFSDNNVASYDNGEIILNKAGHTVATVSYTENNITETATIDIQVGDITYNLIALVPETVNVGESFTINSVRLNRLIDGKIELVPDLGNIVDDCNITWVIKDIGYVDVDNKTFHAMMPGTGTVNIIYINNALNINTTYTKQFEVVSN